MYKLFESFFGYKFVIRLADNTFIPMSEDNTDYQAYLKWLEAGNTPESADE